MRCQTVRNELLRLDLPMEVPPTLHHHLGRCTECRSWLQGLQRLDQVLPHLPAPEPKANCKALFLQRLRAGQTVVLRSEPLAGSSGGPRRSWRNYYGYGAVVAALLVLGVGLASWFGSSSRNASTTEPSALPEDPFLARVVEFNIQLAVADTPTRRMDALTRLADELRQETVQLARIAPGEDLSLLTRLYAQVIQEGILPQLKDMTDAEHRPFLERIAQQFAETERTARALAKEVPPASIEPIHRLERAAGEGAREIRRLLGEAA